MLAMESSLHYPMSSGRDYLASMEQLSMYEKMELISLSSMQLRLLHPVFDPRMGTVQVLLRRPRASEGLDLNSACSKIVSNKYDFFDTEFV